MDIRSLWRRRGGKEPMPRTLLCANCGEAFDRFVEGYCLTTRDMVSSELHWARALEDARIRQDRSGATEQDRLDALAGTIWKRTRDRSAWKICESCSADFVFDRETARIHAVRGSEPKAGPPLRPGEFVLYAALGWQRVYGAWPENIDPIPVVGACTKCEKPIHRGEFNLPATMTAEILPRVNGGFEESEWTTTEEQWMFCAICFAEGHANVDRKPRGSDS